MTINSEDHVQQISMSEGERKARKYSPQTLIQALSAMNHDGLVVLKNVIPVEIIDKINAKMCDDADRMLADPSQVYNHGIKSNFLQRPPTSDAEYLDTSIYFNPFLLQLANAYLGPRPVWNWCTANTALANTTGMRQPAHKDSGFEHPLFPYMFIANIPLCDFSVENGATEFWLGTNALTTHRDQQVASDGTDLRPYPYARMGDVIPPITEEAKQQRMTIRRPIQPECCRGDIMIRDLRTWHAGMPNSSHAHRVMLALGYMSPYYPSYKMSVHLPSSQREFFLGNANDMVNVRAQWYSEDELVKTTADTEFYTRPVYLE
ncbi:phytanoyl-dioxygenase family protein [Xylariaceae sp. FL0255]|nr:phytanoyl-dioxygenase family protein [Xylariaceae sp. FL0255]